MLDFWKKRCQAEQAAEQQRKIEVTLEMQSEILAMYEKAAIPVPLADELCLVKASFEKARRDD